MPNRKSEKEPQGFQIGKFQDHFKGPEDLRIVPLIWNGERYATVQKEMMVYFPPEEA
jgi:hypothetical protein